MTQLPLGPEKDFKVAIFQPFGAPPQGPHGVYMPYIKKSGSLPPKDDP